MTGDNGILTRANEAKELTEEAGANEKVQMEVAGSFDEHGNFDMDKLKENLKENLGLQDSDIKDNGDGSITVTVDGYEILVDAEGSIKKPTPVVTEPPTEKVGEDTIFKDPNSSNKEAYIPKEFKVSEEPTEQKIDTGLVVIAPDGSEFVWVPVDKTTLCVDRIADKEVAEIASGTDYRGVLYNFFSGTTSDKIDKIDIREPDAENYNDENITHLTMMNDILKTNFRELNDFKEYMQVEYNEIIGSIKIKGGFYIGRYESSLSGSNKDTMSETGNIQSKRDVMPTDASNSGTYMWYGLYAKQHEYATVINKTHQTNVKSAMIYGSMYDAIMNWALEDSNEESKVTTASVQRGLKQPTRAFTDDEIKNIYDLGNNLYEWTAEAYYSNGRTCRGRMLSYYSCF